MLYSKKIRFVLILSSIFLLNVGISNAFDDGFASAKKLEGKNIIVYCSPDTDEDFLIQKLNIRPSDIMLAWKSSDKKTFNKDKLVSMLDALFMQVSDILDMHLYSLQVAIKICKDQAQLNSVYTNLFNSSLGGRSSFYAYSFNAIYVSADSFTKEIIGHEMGHVVISHYFVVPPPVKIQEVLAMYVEYNLHHTKIK